MTTRQSYKNVKTALKQHLEIVVELVDMLVGDIRTVIFDAVLDEYIEPDVRFILNQGIIEGSNFPPVLSDDPGTGDPDDPTLDIIIPSVPTLGEGFLAVFVLLTLILGLRAIRLRKNDGLT